VHELVIRRVEADDAAALARMHAYPNVIANTLQLPYPSVASWSERLAKWGKDDILLVGVADGLVIASAGLHLNASRRRSHAALLGISVQDDWQGRGIGRALLAELMRMADGWLNLQRIELTVFADNERALALYQKFGFEVEGTLRAYALREGSLEDVLTMARLQPELNRRRAQLNKEDR
jgi:putative acetyltransferase